MSKKAKKKHREKETPSLAEQIKIMDDVSSLAHALFKPASPAEGKENGGKHGE